ncbi:MAG: hypothetical protein M3N95_14760 [Actinomycetota bacterium]|nr:hypothetical protein [Actinomycetota bacterium]
MTVDDQPIQASGSPPSGSESESASASQLAIENYVAAMRRPRLMYAGVISVVVLGLVAFVAVMWSGSEVAHTTLHTAKQAPPSPAQQSPSPLPRLAWQSSDRTAIGTPLWGGTVVTYSSNSVRGRNARTGAMTWSYTRTDRVVCQAIQDQGVTVAIFEHGGNCDEVTGIDSGTGARKWTRTLDKDGAPVQGVPAYAVGPYTIMLTTPSVIYAFDPSGGLDRWTYAPHNCSINGAALGTAGALISQTCRAPKCDGLTYCGSGPQLLLRDATAGHSDDDKDKANPDQIKWLLLGNTDIPASADQVISAIDTSARALVVFDAPKGKRLTALPLRALSAFGGVPIVATSTASAELVWIGGTAYAVDPAAQKLLWQASTISSPTVTAASGDASSTPDLSRATLAAPSAAGIDILDPRTGSVRQSISIPAPKPGSLVYPFGTGFLVAGPGTITYQ